MKEIVNAAICDDFKKGIDLVRKSSHCGIVHPCHVKIFRSSLNEDFVLQREDQTCIVILSVAWSSLIGPALKPVHPMRLHWAPRHGVWNGCSFLPDTPCTRELEKGLQISLLRNNYLV